MSTLLYSKIVRTARCILFSSVLIIVGIPAFAGSSVRTYENINNVRYVKNYDGDTVTVDISGVLPLIGDNISVRIRGIDTPELRGKCQSEKDKARIAKRLVKAELRRAKTIDLHRVGRGKYFRIIADVKYDGKDLGQVLIKNKLAVPYNGGKKKQDWCRELSVLEWLDLQEVTRLFK